MKSTIIDIPF